MKIQKAYKTELKPNNRQKTLCNKAAGSARFAWNWGLARRIEYYRTTGKSLNAMKLHKELNALKKTDYPWMYDISKCAPQEALRDLDKAYQNFFRGLKTGEDIGFPKFKNKEKSRKSFRLTGAIRVFEDAVQLPRLGRLRLNEKDYLPTESEKVHIQSATVSEQASRWYVSIQVEEEINIPENTGPAAGVDLGILKLATISDGTEIENPEALKRYQRKLRRQQRALARKKSGSKNKQKQKRELEKTYQRIANIRKDALHKATTMLAKSKSIIVLEDLNVTGMVKNHRLAGAIEDASFREFRRQVEYKAKWYGSEIVIADRFYPSSKMCSVCEVIKEDLELSERTYWCESCGSMMSRDLNAARNLEKLAVSSPESLNACKRQEVTVSPFPYEGTVPANEAGIEHHQGPDVLNG